MSGLLKALFRIFCGPSSSKPEQHQQQPHPKPEHPVHEQPQPLYPPKPHRPHRHENVQNLQNEQYQALRAKANVEGNEMARSFQESHEAYARGDGALAKQLSDEGKEHKRKMESLNKQASDWIFNANNKDREEDEIDLHGLYVKEAIAQTDAAIQRAKQLGRSRIRLIVGKGLHSQGGSAKIRPAIEELMRKERLIAELDPTNAGVLIVHIQGERHGGIETGPVLGPDEITRNLEKDDGKCIIM